MPQSDYGSTTAAFHRSQAGYVRILWRLDNDEGGTGVKDSWLRLLLVEDKSGGVGEGVVLLHDGERGRGRVRHRPVLHRRAASLRSGELLPKKTRARSSNIVRKLEIETVRGIEPKRGINQDAETHQW